MGNLLSRRQIIIGATTASLAAAIPSALAEKMMESEPKLLGKTLPLDSGSVQIPFRRYMASLTTLGEGRLLLTGGFCSRPTGTSPLTPQRSAWVFEANTGDWTEVAPMNVARARHASVELNDGRVAVLGGYHFSPIASIELYDPSRNTWTTVRPLIHPRYDHSAVSDGRNVYVIGGSCDSMLGTMEIIRMNARVPIAP